METLTQELFPERDWTGRKNAALQGVAPSNQTKDPLAGALAARFATETEIANGTAKRCGRCKSKWCAFRGEAHCYVMCWDYQERGAGQL